MRIYLDAENELFFFFSIFFSDLIELSINLWGTLIECKYTAKSKHIDARAARKLTLWCALSVEKKEKHYTFQSRFNDDGWRQSERERVGKTHFNF